MSTPATVSPATLFQARRRQLFLILRRELAGQFLRWRGAWIYPLAFAPLLIILVHAKHDPGDTHRLHEETIVYAGIYNFFYLRFAMFFAAAALLSRAFRGEIAERILHYTLLAPLRREILVLGKFVGGVIALVLTFEAAVVATFLAMFGHFPEGRAFLQDGQGMTHLGAYMGATALACAGYGAIFLALGLMFKNVALPALVCLGLETWSGVLPPLLQRLTVTYYMKPLLPVAPKLEGIGALFTVVVEPTPTWIAVTGLVLFVAAVLAYASVRVRSMEINYTTEA